MLMFCSFGENYVFVAVIYLEAVSKVGEPGKRRGCRLKEPSMDSGKDNGSISQTSSSDCYC